MYLSKLLSIVRTYLWLLVLAALFASLTTYLVFNNQPAIYEGKTQLLVGPSLDSASPDLNSLRIGGQLIQTYAELVRTRPVLESINSKLGGKTDLESLEGMIETRLNVDTRILTIVVRNRDPKQAVAVANAAAQSLLEISPSRDNTTALLRTQMTERSQQLEQIIRNSETTIQELEAELAKSESVTRKTPEEMQAALEQQRLISTQLADERTRLSDALRTLATIYQVLLDTNTNQLEIVEPAETAVPVNQNLPLRTATAGLAGLIFALMLVLGIESFEKTIRVPEELVEAVQAPLLGAIEKHVRLTGSGLERVVVFAKPQSGAANDYRSIVAKLLLQIGESTPHSLVLSGVDSRSGDVAATASANLAVALAQAGKQVVLVDAQFHKPVLTKVFQAEDKAGLSDLLLANPPKLSLVSIKELPGVRFLPVGLAPQKGASAMLSTAKANNLIAEIQTEADFVLVVTSPIAVYAENLSLVTQVQGVILSARYAEAQSKDLAETMRTLRTMNVRLLGAIFDHNPSAFVSSQRFIVRSVQSIKDTLRGSIGKVTQQTSKS